MHANPTAANSSSVNQFSYLTLLECSGCGEQYSPDEVQTFCQRCQSTLLARYDLHQVQTRIERQEISGRPGRMWRWHEMLPVREPGSIVHLGEGDTPLLHLPNLGRELGLSNLFVKDESSNPTGSFKAKAYLSALLNPGFRH